MTPLPPGAARAAVAEVDPMAGQLAGPLNLLQVYVLPLKPAQLAVNNTASVGSGAGLSATTVHSKVWQVRVKLEPLWVTPHEAQFGSLKVTMARLLWPWAGAQASAAKAAQAARIRRNLCVMAGALVNKIALRGCFARQRGKATMGGNRTLFR